MKQSQALLFICLLPLLFILSACRGVFFDEEAAKDALLLSKMEEVAVIGTIKMNSDDYCFNINDYEIYFLPDKNVLESDYDQTGYIIFESENNLYIWYLDSGGKISSGYHQEIQNYDKSKPNIFLEPVRLNPDSDTSGLLIINFESFYENDSWNKNSRYNIIEYDDTIPGWICNNGTYGCDGQMLDLGFRIFDDYNSDLPLTDIPFVNGAYISPDDQYLYMLCTEYDEDLDEFRYFDLKYGFQLVNEIPGDANSKFVLSLAKSGTPYLLDPTPYTITDTPWFYDLYYYYDFNTKGSFMSYPIGSNDYLNYFWSEDNILPANEFEEQKMQYNVPMHRFLSTGEFLSYKDNKVKVYNLNGDEKNSYEFGKLHFAYEIENPSGAFSMIFTYTDSPDTDDCSERECSISIYSLATAEIDKL